MYYWSNQGFIKTGAWAFGELVDGAVVHLQPLSAEYLGYYSRHDFHYVQAKMRFLRRSFAPNPIFPQTEVGHGLMSSEYQSLLTADEMRLRVYYMMSRGAKGLLYRCGGSGLTAVCTAEERNALEEEISDLYEELLILRPYLRVGEFVDGVSWTSEPLVEASALQCGDQGIVVLLLNHDRQTAWPREEMYLGRSFWTVDKPDPFRVVVKIPKPMEPELLYMIDRSTVVTKSFQYEEGLLQFDVDCISTTRQFIVTFKGAKVPQNWPVVLPEKAIKFNGGPDIQFERKQWFWGELPPGDAAVEHQFVVRNVGQDGSLVLAVKQVGDNVTVQVPDTPIPPGGSDVVVLSAKRQGLRDHHIVWLTTNDLNEPEVRLEMGGFVREPYSVMPKRIQLKKYLDGRVEADSAGVVIVCRQNGNLELNSVNTSYSKIRAFTRDPVVKTVVGSHAEVYRAERTEISYLIELVADLASRTESGREWLTVGTNSTWKADIQIPIDIDVESAVELSAKRIFFGVISSKVSRQIVLRSSLGPVKVTAMEADHDGITLKAKEDGNKVMLSVTIDQHMPSKKIRGKLRVSISIGNHAEKLVIPYFALIDVADTR